ncbi:MAG TPA: ABC transporter permease [Flavobacteriales bacterium]
MGAGEKAQEAVHWDIEIKPTGPWWRVDFKEIWRYRDLTRLLVRRNLTTQYKQSVLGPLWLFLHPLLVTVTYTVMFGLVARISPKDMPPLLFYLSGIVPWTCFAGVLNRTATSLSGNAALFTKVYFPRLVMPLSTTFSSLFTFAMQVVLMLLIIGFYHFTGRYHWAPSMDILAFPLVILLITLLGLGGGIMVAALTAKYRDFSFVVTFGTQLLMFASPVIVPLEMAERQPVLYTILRANPMTPLIQSTRAMLFGQPVPWGDLVYSAGCTAVMLVLGLMVFQRIERSFTDVV